MTPFKVETQQLYENDRPNDFFYSTMFTVPPQNGESIQFLNMARYFVDRARIEDPDQLVKIELIDTSGEEHIYDLRVISELSVDTIFERLEYVRSNILFRNEYILGKVIKDVQLITGRPINVVGEAVFKILVCPNQTIQEMYRFMQGLTINMDMARDVLINKIVELNRK